MGCGRVGRTVAEDLAERHDVTSVDTSYEALKGLRPTSSGGHVVGAIGDISSAKDLRRVLDNARPDIVVGAVPGYMGFQMLSDVVDLGYDVVDISFPEEDQFELQGLAVERGVRVAVDCGVAPGLWNMVVGSCLKEMTRVDDVTCYVGGLPEVRTKPWEYKAGYSPWDVIEMYTRPATVIERGTRVQKPALSDLHHIEVPGVGTLEAFNTDGLRTLLRYSTGPRCIRSMREMTLRYPGHAEKMKLLRDMGMFSGRSREVVDHVTRASASVRPIDVTAGLLFDDWTYDDGDVDITTMWIDIVGRGRNEERIERHYSLLDRAQLSASGAWTSSMARTTGYTCAAVVEAVLRGQVNGPGVWAPEDLGQLPHVYRGIMRYLNERGVCIDLAEDTSHLG